MGNRTSVLAGLESTAESVTGQLEQEQREELIQKKRLEFDRKVNSIADKIIDLQERQADESLIEMLTTFLDAALRMKDVEMTLSAITDALGCITDVVGIIDDVLDNSMDMFAGSLEHNYGFRERWKRRRTMKKAMRNMRNRMKGIVDTVNNSLKMANQVVGETQKMASTMSKQRAKKKKGKNPPSDKAMDFLAQRKLARDEETSGAASGGSGASVGGHSGSGYGGSGASTTPPSGADSGIDDII